MKSRVLVFTLVPIITVLCGCYPPFHLGDYGYSLCTFLNGTVMDSLTHNPLEAVSIKVYHYKSLEYEGSTDSMGAYTTDELRFAFRSNPKQLSELKKKPPLTKQLELRIVFEKPGYKMFELLIPVGFVCCSPHPQPAPIPEVKTPDVFLVRE